MRRLPIQKAVNLGREEWIMAYMSPSGNSNRRSNYNAANNVYEGLMEASRDPTTARRTPAKRGAVKSNTLAHNLVKNYDMMIRR